MKNNGFSAERKDKVKILRSIGEGIILISLLIIILKSLLSFSIIQVESSFLSLILPMSDLKANIIIFSLS